MTRADASGAATADAQSDAENTESEEDDHVMDPSDPRAHGRQNLTAKSKQQPSKSRWDSDGDDGEEDESEEVDEDLGVPVQMDDDEEEQKQPAKETVSAEVTEKLKARLSGWAAARFLVPRSERKLPVLEEPPLEPLNDFILSDFGTRFRGGVQVQSTVAQDDDTDSEDGDNKFQVGAPLFSADGSPLDDKDEAAKKPGKDKDNKDKDKEPKKRRPENRYFITDLATKCFNCGQVGHMSAVCANDKLQKPCYYCALRGHSSFACPHLPCSACMQVGHEFKDCPNKRVKRSISCGLCGRAGHESDDCDTSSRGGLPVTCMVCVEDGHLHCAPIPPPADRRAYCAYCAGNHKISHCREYVQPATMSFTARLPRSDMKCFVCNTAGHIAAECPKRTNYNNGGGSCFNCGQRGHYASDCPSARGGGGGGNNNSSNSRKRGRNEYYAEDDDEDEGYSRGRGGRSYSQRNHTRYEEQYEDDDASEDQYYYVPNGGQSKKKPRLDAALPSYRHSNNSNSGGGGGGSGGYKGNNNRNQRNGNGNGNGGGNGDRRRYR